MVYLFADMYKLFQIHGRSIKQPLTFVRSVYTCKMEHVVGPLCWNKRGAKRQYHAEH
jgi:hypothetical protein